MLPMPNVLVLIVCRVVILGDIDPHTGWQNTEWNTEGGVMHCKREQVELYDPAPDQGALPVPFTPIACMRAAMMLGPQFDVDATHAKRPWRFWRAACPTKVMDDNGTPDNPRDDKHIGWSIPACPEKHGVLECESDTAI
jgi:hypothetical protein